MDNSNPNKTRTLLLMQLSRLMPNLSVEEIYNNANAFLLQTFGNLNRNIQPIDSTRISDFRPTILTDMPQILSQTSFTSNNDTDVAKTSCFTLKFPADAQQIDQGKLEEEVSNSDNLNSVEASLIKTELDSTSPSTANIIDEKKETVKQEYDFDLRCGESSLMQSLKTEETIVKEEYCGLLKQSKKIFKEKVQSALPEQPLDLKSQSSSKTRQPYRTRKDVWKDEEDAELRKYYDIFGPKWSKLAELIGGKTGKQVRDRYLNALRPDIHHKEWTESELKMLESLVEKHGKKWCLIASQMPGRTENQVKNKYYCTEKKEATKTRKKLRKLTSQSLQSIPQSKELQKSGPKDDLEDMIQKVIETSKQKDSLAGNNKSLELKVPQHIQPSLSPILSTNMLFNKISNKEMNDPAVQQFSVFQSLFKTVPSQNTTEENGNPTTIASQQAEKILALMRARSSL